MFFLLYKHTDNSIFDDFPKISDLFLKIFQNCSEGQTNVPKHFQRISENFWLDVWRFPKTFEEDPKKFQWYTNDFKYKLRDKLDISEISGQYLHMWGDRIVLINLLPLGIPPNFI